MGEFNIDATETKTMNALKDFQRATVERIDYLFRAGQNRVLIADEVGMGKTLIARGAIVKVAKIRKEENGNFLRVAYICSNTSIASQNVQKLRVSSSAKIEGITDTRLSMLHLKIAMQESDEDLKAGYIQLIPFTPDTSFRPTHGGGTYNERALMFAILKRLPEFSKHLHQLEKLFVYGAEKAWNGWIRDEYIRRVAECETRVNGKYPQNIIERLYDYDQKKPFLNRIIEHCQKGNASPYKPYELLNSLRLIFGQISTEMLEPDLVIMDEFQRFRFLLNSENNSETSILVQKFLSGGNTRVLLLSATPYKLYTTLEEIDAAQIDEHYHEFLQVMDFLLGDKKADFHKVWADYSVALHEISDGNTSILQIKKAAEDAMYAGVCRTERVSVMNSGDYTDDSSVHEPIKPTEQDILSYIAAGNLLREAHAGYQLPIDYVKSSPYLMSFMRNYKVKQDIEKYFTAHPEEISKAKGELLWVNPSLVNDYKPLPPTNARFEKLKEIAFMGGAELYLWVPPSRPYYSLQGAYKNSKDFSKVLVFSSWEMVPRMIGALISYEAERRTVGKLSSTAKLPDKKNTRYNAKYRYPYHRLQFSLSGEEPQRMSLFCLLYPSRTLANLYNPIKSMNQHQSLTDIERQIKSDLRPKIEKLKEYQNPKIKTVDAKWYYLAPMLMDGMIRVRNWLSDLESALANSDGDADDVINSGKGKKSFKRHIEQLRVYAAVDAKIELGRIPDDLLDTLTNMVLGSPAVCIYRGNGNNTLYATSLARLFINYFNSTESTAIVELAASQFHAKKADDNTHWQDVLLYCKDGCFQAMFDEYRHLIKESASFSDPNMADNRIHWAMMNDLRIHTASYDVDTFQNFRSRIHGDKKRYLMRAHYAVGFVTDGDDEKKANRKDSIRGAFNSPLKPFVLASTSIGQEGLDFHNYCRKIMHWNLPSNPIDLEQREGRINRFKCLAIRQNVAASYGNIAFKKDIWEEMFHAAQAEKKEHQSDLVPFWCFGENQKIKIERIVPMYPMSKDEITYDRLIKILSLYRLTLGQARQEELLTYLFKECHDTEALQKLFINLSPFSKPRQG